MWGLIALAILPYVLGFICIGWRTLLLYTVLMLALAISIPTALDVCRWDELAEKHHGNIFAQSVMAGLSIAIVGGGFVSILLKSILLKLKVSNVWLKALIPFSGILLVLPVGMLYLLMWRSFC